MRRLYVVVDSTAGIGTAILQSRPCLRVVPLTVSLGQQTWLEPELSYEELFRLVAAGRQHPRTSQPSPGDFLSVLRPLAEEGADCIIITLSGGLSGTVGSAQVAATMLAPWRAHVVDSGTTAMGMEKMAFTALELAAAGLSAEDIANRLRALAAVTHTLFIPDTLEYLHKGGRIGGAAALFGSILQIKPILYLTNGRVSVLDKVRTRSRALSRMAEELRTYGPLAYIGVVHMGAGAEADALAEMLSREYPAVPVTVTTAGAVLGAHLGPGLIGIVFQQVIK